MNDEHSATSRNQRTGTAKRLYLNAYNQFEASPNALKAIIAAKNKRKQEF